MNHNRSRAVTGLFAAGALALSACATTGPVQPYAEDAKVECAGKQDLTASGSTAQANAMTHFIKAYQDACPGRIADLHRQRLRGGNPGIPGRHNRFRRLGLTPAG